MKSIHLLGTLALLCSLPACGDGGASALDPFTLLLRGQYSRAVDACEAALPETLPGSEERRDLALARAEALGVGSPIDAAGEFLEFALDEPELFPIEDYRYLASRFRAQGSVEGAFDVLAGAWGRWPGEPELRAQLDDVVHLLQEGGSLHRVSAWKSCCSCYQ